MEKSQINLKLGDIIEITSPGNLELDGKRYLIEYIDNTKIIINNVSDFKTTTLRLQDVTGISILYRDKNEGYARQNGLSMHTWVDITIGDNIVTGEITNLEEDMIEVTTFPDRRVIYFDFAYKGPLTNIDFEIRDKPVIEKKQEEPEQEPEPEQEEQEEPDYRDLLNDLCVDADTIIFGDELEDLYQVVEVPESERRYGVELQVNDMMDELLSTIPNRQRTEKVMNTIHVL